MLESMMAGAPALTPEAAAEGAIRAYCGWHVAPVIAESIVVDGNGQSRLKLPTMRVEDVSRVEVDGVDVTSSVRWSDMGMLEGVRFPRRFRAVKVDLSHGFEPEMVADVLGVLASAARRFESDPRIRSQSVAGASVSYAVDGGAPLSHLLTGAERAALDAYRLYRGV